MAIQVKEHMETNPKEISRKSDVKILIVDDREDNLFSIETILERDRYTIIKANSGRAALKILLHQHDFSLILMDVQMPDLDGMETAKIIYEREKLKNIPIIFITAHSYDESYLFTGYKMGGVDYIYKPINPDLLRMKVAVFVELYRKNQQLQQQERRLLAANKSLHKEIEERKASEEKIKLLNEQLLQNNEHLKLVNEELDRFAFAASHDLQEPLRKIMVFSDKILSNGIDPESEKYFKKIINSSKRMQSLINDLLSFSKHSMSAADYKYIDLNKLIKEAINELELEIEKNNVTIELSELPTIWAVPSLIRQLFYNLISNAIKFSKKDIEPIITIKAEKVSAATNGIPIKNPDNKSFYKISVKDNGIGFDPQYAEDIFMVFKRLHSYHDYEGSGVGLSICKKIVEKHNGFIMATSKPNEGSTFIIGLPEMETREPVNSEVRQPSL
jgi:signal transduction histidine kinase